MQFADVLRRLHDDLLTDPQYAQVHDNGTVQYAFYVGGAYREPDGTIRHFVRDSDRLNAKRVYRTALAVIFGQEQITEGPDGELVLTYRVSDEERPVLAAWLQSVQTDGGVHRRAGVTEYPFD